MKNKAFTLIELLVVVLIIGILAAIAVPQYQLVVDKAQFANLQSLGKTIKTAFDNYYLTTGEYAENFNKLDITFSSYYQYISYWDAENCVIFPDTYCCVGIPKSNTQSQHIICGRNDYLFAWVYYPTISDKFLCVSANENNRAQRLCENISNKPAKQQGNLITPYGHKNNNGNRYSLWILK